MAAYDEKFFDKLRRVILNQQHPVERKALRHACIFGLIDLVQLSPMDGTVSDALRRGDVRRLDDRVFRSRLGYYRAAMDMNCGINYDTPLDELVEDTLKERAKLIRAYNRKHKKAATRGRK